MRILFLSANSFESGRLALDKEYREISESKELTRYRDEIELFSAFAVRPKDFFNKINNYEPDILHFCGHGEENGDLIFEDDNGNNKYLSKNVIEKMIESISGKIKLIVFNNCYSYVQAEIAVKYVDITIGMRDKIGDEAAIKFALQLYSSIGYGLSIKKAFDQAKSLMMTENEKWQDIPIIYNKNGVIIDNYKLIKTNTLGVDNLKTNFTQKIDKECDENFRSIRIYLSSTNKDISEYRKIIEEVVKKLKMKYCEIEYIILNERNTIEERFSKIDLCNVFIGIYAWEYGYIPDNEEFSVTEYEYNYVMEKDIMSFCYVIDSEYPWKTSLIEFKAYEKLKKFREKILISHREKFININHLKNLVNNDLSKILQHNSKFNKKNKELIQVNSNNKTENLNKQIFKIKKGDYVQFGKYYNDLILWRCMDVNQYGYLLVSEFILCLKAFDAAESGKYDKGSNAVNKNGSNNWEDSNIREWLNSYDCKVDYTTQPPTKMAVWNGYNPYVDERGFLSDFTKDEFKKIVFFEHDGIKDKIFLLSIKELETLFNNNEDRIKCMTKKAVEYSNYKSICVKENKEFLYWTRSSLSSSPEIVYVVEEDGNIDNYIIVYRGNIGVVPSLYLKSNFCKSGEGSKNNPYII